jgi:glutathione synthase/RimK-type ligase-like ATP-grasp enzyme
MILLWGLPDEPPLALVNDALTNIGHCPFLLDQEAELTARLDMSVDSRVDGVLVIGDRRVDLKTITAFYMRPYDPIELLEAQGLSRGSREVQMVLMFEDILTSWADLTSALVVNRPTAAAVNSSKPYQALKLRSLGFEIPETIVTTDPDAVEEFLSRHDKVIYKSISGVRSIVSQFTPSHRERLADVCWSPTQFQEYVKGVDYRVHVVGDQVFACQVISTADDYRYASCRGVSVEIRPCTLPSEVADRCVRATREMGLAVSGIDLRRTLDERWFCFEVNSSPGFSYYEQATGQPIAEAIARLLISD